MGECIPFCWCSSHQNGITRNLGGVGDKVQAGYPFLSVFLSAKLWAGILGEVICNVTSEAFNSERC